LVFHPNVSLSFLYSRSNSGTKISDLYPDLTTVCEMVLTDQPEEVDILVSMSSSQRKSELADSESRKR
jgi:N-acetyl-gamma-glutamyl-phosphate reductase